MGYVRVGCQEAVIHFEPSFAYGGLKMTLRARGKGEEPVDLPQVNQFAAEMDHFAECILQDKQPLTPGEEGLAAMQVIDRLFESAASGKTLAV